MIRRLMELAISGRAVIIGLAIALLLSGIYAFSQLDIEAYPDPVQPTVELLTLPNGLSAEEVERLVTVPLEYTLSSTRNLESMRSISLFGLSDIRCYFSWDSDYYWDRSETVNQLQFVSLPPGITAGISPENSIGKIYRYTVESPDHDLINEKTVNDWIVARQLSTVPGIIGDSTFGGLTKQYHVDVDPQKLDYYHIPLSTLTGALGSGGPASTMGAFAVLPLVLFRKKKPAARARPAASPAVAFTVRVSPEFGGVVSWNSGNTISRLTAGPRIITVRKGKASHLGA